MNKPLVDRIPFVKIMLGFVLVFVIALGMCGLTGVGVWQGGKFPPGVNRFLERSVGYDLAGMILAVAGLVVTAVVWVVMTIGSRFTNKKS